MAETRVIRAKGFRSLPVWQGEVVYGDLAHRYISRAACAAEGVGARVVVGAHSLVDHWVVGGTSPKRRLPSQFWIGSNKWLAPQSAGASRVQVIFQEALVVMIPFKTKVARATGPRWVHLVVALVPAALAAPAGAQLQEALTAQVQVDRAAAQSQGQINEIRDRTQDAAGRYAQAMADADSLERFNAQLARAGASRKRQRSLRSSSSCSTSRRPTAKSSR